MREIRLERTAASGRFGCSEERSRRQPVDRSAHAGA
jgi:hypothetical protein